MHFYQLGIYIMLTEFVCMFLLESLNEERKTFSNFLLKASSLRTKLKSGLRVRHEGPSDDVRFSPIETLEYPGNDEEKLTKITELWEEYYDCLDAQYASLGHHKRIPPIAVTVLENRNIHLTCDLCQSPQQADSPIKWYRLDTPFGTAIQIGESDNYILSEDDILSIYRAQPELAGIYYCKTGDTRTNPYYLHVFGDDEPLIVVKPETAKNGPYAMKDVPLFGGLKVTTVWSSWSECSRCGIVGRRKRFGACTVVADVNKNISESQLTEELKMNEASSEVGYLGFLMLFTGGLPCRSKLLPLWIRKLNELKRPNEIMVAFCKQPCTDTVFEVKDQFGNIIETANNSAGIFSALQGPPHLLPMITRATFYCPLNEPFVVLCPGTLFMDSPIEWFVNKTIRIIPWIVSRDSNGRVQIDSRERLTFRSIQKEDERIYSCWQGGQIAGIVRLVPYDSNAISIDHHVLLVGIISILSIFVFLAVRIYLNKQRAAL